MNGFDDIGRLLLLAGGVLLLTGAAVLALGRIPGFGRLPGDITIQTGNFSCFIPIVSMILVSVLLTVVLNVVARFLNR